MMIKDSIRVGHVTLKNRMVKAPIHSGTCIDGHITAETEKHYEERTRGGRFGLVVVEHCYVRSDGMASPSQMSASRDSDLEGMKRICDIIHGNGSAAILQINHAGFAANRSFTGRQPVSASANPVFCHWPGGKAEDMDQPRALTVNEIHELQTYYIRAAKRAMKAGYDGINLHSAHGFLLNQFYSPICNKRTDAYNGYTIEGRTRFHMELIPALREAIGPDALFSIRIGGSDYETGGTTIEDTVEASRLFESAGIDLIDISGGTCCFTRPGHTYPGYFGDVSQAVKKEVNIPVLLTGGVKTVDDAEMLLQEGKADMIGVGRIITARADWGMELAD